MVPVRARGASEYVCPATARAGQDAPRPAAVGPLVVEVGYGGP